MIVIDNTIVSEDIRDIRFCCDLKKCKGACCIEGDAGAPIEEEEISQLEDFIDEIKPYMTNEGIKVIESNGIFDFDEKGEYVTPLVNNRECAYVYFENGITRCAIEKAFEEGKIYFQKPVSCHLYPIRITKHKDFEAVNYHKWYICQSACTLGKDINLPLYKFLKEPLVRKYGEGWYSKLVEKIEIP
ncbi:MAG: DUF3109 family protein [Bacteroidetes bacterium]|nr:DUF3109 family protein [Bacteroidota bacterium]MBL7104194.1 DUF3109 family protein [Bacteroidales bacterium]